MSQILRLALINVAVGLTFVPIDSTLNRIMISDLGLPSTLVALLIVLPYLFSPIQVWIGGFSDRQPLFGYQRTPYIVVGVLLCAVGASLTPTAAFLLATSFWWGLVVGIVAFGMWGMGFNIATVAYLSLTTDLAGEQHRARAIGVMWFVLILSMITAGILIGRALRPYSQEALFQVFYLTNSVAALIGLLALVKLEPRFVARVTKSERRTFRESWNTITGSPQARLFFVYLILLLVALLGQDLLLEPYAADVFGVPVDQTSRYVSIWGVALLVALLLASSLTRWVGKVRAAAIGGVIAAVGLCLIAMSGVMHQQALLIPALLVFGFGSGLSTATNLALMLDMTVPGQVGVFIGAWGMADALARMCGTLLSGVVRDAVGLLFQDVALGYITVFFIEAGALVLSLWLLRYVSVARFRSSDTPGTAELSALVGEARGG